MTEAGGRGEGGAPPLEDILMVARVDIADPADGAPRERLCERRGARCAMHDNAQCTTTHDA
eukprot:4959227-Pyramimonas_sp.AAC.2